MSLKSIFDADSKKVSTFYLYETNGHPIFFDTNAIFDADSEKRVQILF